MLRSSGCGTFGSGRSLFDLALVRDDPFMLLDDPLLLEVALRERLRSWSSLIHVHLRTEQAHGAWHGRGRPGDDR